MKVAELLERLKDTNIALVVDDGNGGEPQIHPIVTDASAADILSLAAALRRGPQTLVAVCRLERITPKIKPEDLSELLEPALPPLRSRRLVTRKPPKITGQPVENHTVRNRHQIAARRTP